MEWELVVAAEADKILTEILDPLLADRGLRPTGRRRWVRAFPPIRHLFEVALMKGATFAPSWGLSLDFVPHVTSNRLAWHRTDKSARCDLIFDPVDFYADWQDRWSIDGLHGAEGFRRDAERVLPAAVDEACAWLDGARSEEAALAKAEWLRASERPGNRFGFRNFVQQPLAYAVLLAHAGRSIEAKGVLDDWIECNGHQSLREKLVALLAP